MANSGVNAFSKQARLQGMGPNPSNRADLQGSPIIKDFLSIVFVPVGNLCPILVNIFSKHARFHDLGPIQSNAGYLQELPIIKDFLSNDTFHVLNLCQIIVSTFSRNKRGFMIWDQFHRTQGTCKGGQS